MPSRKPKEHHKLAGENMRSFSRKGLARRAMNIAKRLPKGRQSDILYAYLRFYSNHDRWPTGQDLFNDRLFQLKRSGALGDPLRVFTTDKEFSKIFIAGLVGHEHVVPTLAVLRTPEDLDGYDFPERCCVKGTAASGLVRIVTDGKVDKSELRHWFQANHYDLVREQNYYFLTPKIIVEPLLYDKESLDDIKIFISKGKAKLFQWDFDRAKNHTRRLYDRNWRDLNCSMAYPMSEKTMVKPLNLESIVESAEKVGKYFDFVRVDMYTDGSDFHFGEITHCHGSADEVFIPPSAEKIVSDILFRVPAS